MDGEIHGAELEQALETGDPLVVDIRNPRSFAREHVAGSVNVPLAELPDAAERVAGADHVVTVCPHGKASVRAARMVASFETFDGRVESLACGFEGWAGPVESDSAPDTGAGTDTPDTPDAPF